MITSFEKITGMCTCHHVAVMPTQGCGSIEMAAFIRAACVVFLSLSVARGDQNQISLNGDKWTLSDEAGKVKNIQATVPGVTHLDLM